MEKKDLILVTFRMPRTLHKEFRQFAEQRGLKIAFAISQAIEQYIAPKP